MAYDIGMSIEVEPREPFSKKILLQVTTTMFDRLGRLCAEHQLSRNELMRQLLEYGIDELEKRTTQANQEDTTRGDDDNPADPVDPNHDIDPAG